MVGVEAIRAGTESLDEAFRLHQPRLVRRLALVVGDAEEAKDLAVGEVSQHSADAEAITSNAAVP